MKKFFFRFRLQMSHQYHSGVSCDHCRKRNFPDRRYKCLICFDFDLCASCYDQQIHSVTHPMQLILTKNNFEEIYFDQKEKISSCQSFKCPFCSINGFTVDLFIEHVNEKHRVKRFVLCPICFIRSNDLVEHLHRHREKKTIESNPTLPFNHRSLLQPVFDNDDKERVQHENHLNRSRIIRSFLFEIFNHPLI